MSSMLVHKEPIDHITGGTKAANNCWVVSSNYKESRNNMPMLPNLSPSPNLQKVQSVYNNNVAS